ncbi:Fe-S cluster assembly sulfur transfer protein SufU [Floricoccus penangensis]|uniref:Fe-S cluster assembly sulfur transfer protein SufU n=1 Tax=Floricoccus penangensis TaxID=1859475 RepID=UPI00203EB826|nr:SUF system NifU family Fe-S cluster assembly protein [Floricoccus penangensis]URZ86812.1 SUF system NifU family Fe-S cluster assembly protein [Floricoccus penangensis]
MALSRLDNLYRAVILDHSNHPHHRGSLDTGTQIDLNNPTCGDVIKLSVAFDGDTISDIAFDGSGCSISTSSASMMTDAVIGKSKEEAYQLAEVFSEMVQGVEDPDQEKLGEAKFLAGVAKFPQRIKCATLSWNALKKALESGDEGIAVNLEEHK